MDEKLLSREALMNVMTKTPFGRPLTATLMKRAEEAQAPVAVDQIDKWALFRDICTARAAFGLSDRALTVLNALLSFHKGQVLDAEAQLVVFPSNRALSTRAHGMAESTLRRHLAALGHAGLIQRHDSPNGKRYAARGAGGAIAHAFGFDLRPLLVRAAEIAQAATAAQEAAERIKRLREAISLMKRDALQMALYGRDSGVSADWDRIDGQMLDLHRQTRRVLDADALDVVKGQLEHMLAGLRELLKTEEMSGSHRQIERHIHNSKEDSSDLEPCLEKAGGETCAPSEPDRQGAPPLPLGLVMKACPDIAPYARHDIRHWHELVATASEVRGMMGISQDAWTAAGRAMGPEAAAVTVAAILQRVDDIRSPGGYLRSLTEKAGAGGFSPAPMVMALLRAS